MTNSLTPRSSPNPLVRAAVVGWLGVAGCLAGDEQVASEVTWIAAPPREPEVVPATGRWAPHNDAPGVCAWLGAEFTIADFVPPSEPIDPYCISYAWCGWAITGDDEPRLYVEAPSFLDPPPLWPLPIARPEGVEPLCRSPAIAHAVEDGWLVGLDSGEWGAAVWWISSDGGQTRRLAELAVVGFFARGDTIWAPAGDHRTFDGPVLRFERDELDGWRAIVEPQRLRSMAMAASLDGDALLVATYYSVEAIDLAGNVEVLAEVDWFSEHPWPAPRSVARRRDGTILVGMSHAVVRLTPERGGTREEWLVPPACAVSGWVPGRIDCACAGLEPPGFSQDHEVMFRSESGPG